MATIVGVRFRNAGKTYYFAPGDPAPGVGTAVLAETARGLEYGQVVLGATEMPEERLASPLKSIVRIADAEDARRYQNNLIKEKEAFRICQQKIAEHHLEMKLVSVEYTFDGAKILFYFTANGRVDFRALVKDLAGIFHTRIELKQIGVRDEAKMLGGLGMCGRPICCAQYMSAFQPVSIRMAKDQNLSLNPTKISGMCGRLMCCLKYEQDHYEASRKRLPRVGRTVITPDGPGTVADVNVLSETVRVRVSSGDEQEIREYPAAQVQRPNSPAPVDAPPPAENNNEGDEDEEFMETLEKADLVLEKHTTADEE